MEIKELRVLKQNNRQKISLVKDSNGKKYLKREINGDKSEIYKVLQKINNPNIPKIYSVELTGNTTVLEEYIDGESLSSLMEQSATFNKKEIRFITNQLLSALEALHKENILHRDIKPDNILIDKNGHIWLIDYDIARIYRNEVRKDTETMGTFGYAPIEQYGMMPTDFKSDIYAFGITLKAFLDYTHTKGYLRKIADKCRLLDPSQRYESVSAIKKAVLLNSRIPLITVFSALAFVLISVIVILYFNPSDNTAAKNSDIPDKLPTQQSTAVSETKPDEKTDSKDNAELSDSEQSDSEKKEVPEETPEESIVFDGEFANFPSGPVEEKYSQYSHFSSVVNFSTDTPYYHLLFLEDMNKKGKIKFGENDAVTDADITLSDGTLAVSLKDQKGRTFNHSFKYNGQYSYEKSYTSNLRKNADIMCYDFDGDGSKELLIGLCEAAIGVSGDMFYNNFNYCIAWCIKYTEDDGFILCEGDMFSKYCHSFSINKYTRKLNVAWESLGDVMGYIMKENKVVPDIY